MDGDVKIRIVKAASAFGCLSLLTIVRLLMLNWLFTRLLCWPHPQYHKVQCAGQ